MKESMATTTSLSPHPTPIVEGNEEHSRTGFRSKPVTPAGENRDKHRDDVSFNKCRPREKISAAHFPTASPTGILNSVLSSLTPRRSPRPPDPSKEKKWKIAAAELSTKLARANRKRDEAIRESSRLKHSLSELEQKVDRLETYFKTGLTKVGHCKRVVDHFLALVSEARSTVRILARAMSHQLRRSDGDRISLESMLSRSLFEDFESVGFRRGGSIAVLNPVDRCESNFAAFVRLRGLTWEEVLSKGTRHFSEEFSGFCDRKISEVAGMLGWNRAWPEPLLRAFFGASKTVWLVHLLANSVQPGFPILRVENGAVFDPVYMEDAGGDGGSVRIMVAPGFYVYDSVVKCKVYRDNHNRNVDDYDKGFTLSSSDVV